MLSVHAWAGTAADPKSGVRSSATVIVKVSVAVSPSASVAVQVYCRASCGSVGVPLSVRVAASSVRPGGGAGVRP